MSNFGREEQAGNVGKAAGGLTSAEQRALDVVFDKAADAGLSLVRPQVVDALGARAYLASAELGCNQLKGTLDKEQERLDRRVKPVLTDPKEFEAVVAVVRELERRLLSPTDLLSRRIDEGRRSVEPKIHTLVTEHLSPQVREEGGRLVAGLDVDGLNKLQGELPGWVDGWAAYVRDWVTYDLNEGIRVAWQPLGRPFPVAPPRLPEMGRPQVAGKLEMPKVQVERDPAGLHSSAWRNGRSAMYGLLSIAGLVGLRSGTGVTGGGVVMTVILAGFGFIAAVGFGYYQATQEREKELRRIEEQARERADRAIREALRVWLDRCKDKLQQKMQEELRVLRSALQTWYNAEVLPAHDRALAEHERARKVEEEAKDKARNLAERRKKIDSLREKIKAAQVLVDGPALA
jgi:hypothetical protein